ncbi:putative permease, DMT superfamily [Geoglobus ahangari]|uniref:Putative permease, DMT superfamily n=1 Tax=Geoglobus ahangari TaxID=113653 RepID=A0A0F7IFC6_9EURY|nr:EamA family transporter [Geoglobus ahangari]AKG91492.1 putative permease, DMT superfamily [Geoglobus ahangari]NOY12007.1 EamA family transporter [Archaeoglobi archaeon]
MRGELAVLLSAILMGTLPYFIKSLQLSPFSATFYRVSVGLMFVALFMLIRRERPVFGKELALLGVLNTGVVFFYITAITHLSAATAALLLYMAPVYVMVFAMVKGGVTRTSILSLVLGITGLYLLLSPEKELNVGIISGFISGLVYAGAFIMLNRLGKVYSPIQITFSNLLIGVILLAPLFRFEFGDPILTLGLGLIPTAIPFILLSYGMGRVRVEKGPVIALIEPVTAGTVGFLAFHEVLSGVQLFGALLVLCAVFLSLREGS